MDTFIDTYLDTCKEAKGLVPLPELDLVVGWLKESHKNIALQLYTADVVQETISPLIDAIGEAVAESFMKIPEELEKEAQEESEDTDEAHN
jgi:hypothetical protein